MTLTSHQRPGRGVTVEWLTPPEILAAVGPFDLDPCAPVVRPWPMADHHYTVADDGLSMPWFGLVWCNPPFGPDAGRWLDRCAAHGSAIALTPARTETRWFVRTVWQEADAVLFLHGRPHFHHPDGRRGNANSGAPICLIAYGATARNRLVDSGLAGSLVETWRVAYKPSVDGAAFPPAAVDGRPAGGSLPARSRPVPIVVPAGDPSGSNAAGRDGTPPEAS